MKICKFRSYGMGFRKVFRGCYGSYEVGYGLTSEVNLNYTPISKRKSIVVGRWKIVYRLFQNWGKTGE